MERQINEKIQSIMDKLMMRTNIPIDEAIIKPPSASETDLLYFAVDNISPPDRNSFIGIIRSLEHTLKQAPHVKQEVPLAWIKSRDEFLHKAESDKIVSLTLEEAT